MKYITLLSTDPCYNMAFESWALKNLPKGESYFYLWRNRPSVIIGENQDPYTEVNLQYLTSHGITLARRTTGGGAVYHDLNNLNYSFIGENVGVESIVDMLRLLGVNAEKTGRNDIFVDGRKVSGYARRMECDRWLVHGTLLYDVDLDTLQRVLDTPQSKLRRKGVKSVRSAVANLKDYLPKIVGVEEFASAAKAYFEPIEEYVLSGEQLGQISGLNEIKFSSPQWIYRHLCSDSIVRRAHLSCGSVSVSLSLDSDGRIENIDFSGDFLGAKKAEELAFALRGIKYDSEALLQTLKKERAEDYFDSTSLDQLVSLIISDTLG